MARGYGRFSRLDARCLRLLRCDLPVRRAGPVFSCQQGRHRSVRYRYAGDASGRCGDLRHVGRSLRAAAPANGQRHLLLHRRTVERLFPELHCVLYSAPFIRHRNGRRVGRRCLACYGARSRALARRTFRDPAERISDWLPAGRDRRASGATQSWLAGDVLGRRLSGPACALYSDQGTRIGSVAAASTAPGSPCSTSDSCCTWSY